MPVFDENAPLPTHLPKPPLFSKDTDGFLVPAVPVAKRLRPLSVNVNTGKKVVPKHRGGSVSLSKGTGGVVGLKQDGDHGEGAKREKREIGEGSFWGDMSLTTGVELGKKKEEALKKVEKRVKAVEMGLKASSKKTEERFQSIASTLVDIQTDLLLRAQPSSFPNHNPAISSAAAIPVSLKSPAPFPASPIRLPLNNRLISEFGERNSTGFGSPPVPALLSKRRKELAMRRMSGLSLGEVDESMGDISVYADEVSGAQVSALGVLNGEERTGMAELYRAEIPAVGIDRDNDKTVDRSETAVTARDQTFLPVDETRQIPVSPNEEADLGCPPITASTSGSMRERDGKERERELEDLKQFVELLQIRVNQQGTVIVEIQAQISLIGSRTSKAENPPSSFYKQTTFWLLLVITLLAVPYLPHHLKLSLLALTDLA